jgi:hypothetical protein
MPPTSEQLPFIGIYYFLCILTVICSTSMTVITLHINNKGSRECRLPNFLKIFLFKYIACILRINLNQPVKLEYNSMFETIQKEKDEIEKLNENSICCINEFDRIFNENFFDLMNSINNTAAKREIRLLETERKEFIKNEWSDAAQILDRLFFYFFTITTIAFSLVMYLNSPKILMFKI